METKKDMHANFDMIIPRLKDSFTYLDWEKARNILKNIRRNCLCVGVGGSYAPSVFASIVLEDVNKIIAMPKEARNIMFMNLFYNYFNLLGITYGNNNHGINQAEIRASDSKCETHLITANSNYEEDICYKGQLPLENSFISLAGTVIPMSILLCYYLKNDQVKTLCCIENIYAKANQTVYGFALEDQLPLFEIMSDQHTCVASHILESTIIEAGLGIPVIHDKYNYCHGRSTLSYQKGNSNLIYLINEQPTDLDNMLLDNISEYYSSINIVQASNNDYIVNQFDLALQSFFLCKELATKEKKDLSIVNYSPAVQKLYKYDGGM